MVSSSPYGNTYSAGLSVIHICMGFQVLSKTGLVSLILTLEVIQGSGKFWSTSKRLYVT